MTAVSHIAGGTTARQHIAQTTTIIFTPAPNCNGLGYPNTVTITYNDVPVEMRFLRSTPSGLGVYKSDDGRQATIVKTLHQQWTLSEPVVWRIRPQ